MHPAQGQRVAWEKRISLFSAHTAARLYFLNDWPYLGCGLGPLLSCGVKKSVDYLWDSILATQLALIRDTSMGYAMLLLNVACFVKSLKSYESHLCSKQFLMGCELEK